MRLLNHGIGFPTAAIELILPTYGEHLGLKGKVATHFALNPHPTLIPAIESGWVEQIHCFGSEVGMDVYVQERSDVYFTGHDGSLRSNRMMCQNAGLYACDMFIGSTLQIDLAGNSSTFTSGRVAGFGGAPNMGSDVHGRRHPSAPWLTAGREATDNPTSLTRGRKLVVQIVETFGEKMVPSFVEKLDSLAMAEELKLDLAPVMIYGDDVTHIVTEDGIANLLLCRSAGEREQAIRGVAGFTAGGACAGPQSRGGVAAARGDPTAGGSRYRSAGCDAPVVGGPLDPGSRHVVRRTLSPAFQIQELVGGSMEQFQVRGTAARRAPGTRREAIVGVNASGNLEVLVERVLPDRECLVEVSTAVVGFRDLWQAVIEDFFAAQLAGRPSVFDQRWRRAPGHGDAAADARGSADGGRRHEQPAARRTRRIGTRPRRASASPGCSIREASRNSSDPSSAP